MPRNLDIGVMRAFVTVAETCNMTTAAGLLNLTQGAVSQQIKRLEESLDTPVFERGRKGLRLTDAGERLFGKARQLVSLNDEIWGEMTTATFSGRVRLGVPYDLVSSYMPPVFRAYARAYPKVEISLVCLSSLRLAEALSAGELDVALVEQPLGSATGECLAVERLVWVGARGGDAHARRPLPLSTVSDSCAFRPVLFDALRRHGIAWRSVFENENMEAASATIHTDLAVTAFLASTVPPDLEVLGQASGLPELPAFAISLHLPRTGATPAADAMARQLREGFVGRARQAA